MREKKAEQTEKKRRSKKENPMGTSFDTVSVKKKKGKSNPIKNNQKETVKTNKRR